MQICEGCKVKGLWQTSLLCNFIKRSKYLFVGLNDSLAQHGDFRQLIVATYKYRKFTSTSPETINIPSILYYLIYFFKIFVLANLKKFSTLLLSINDYMNYY